MSENSPKHSFTYTLAAELETLNTEHPRHRSGKHLAVVPADSGSLVSA